MRIVLVPYACEASRSPVAAAAQVSVFVLFLLASTLVRVQQAKCEARAVAAKRRFRHASTAIRAKPRLCWYQITNTDAKVQILTLCWYKSTNTDASASVIVGTPSPRSEQRPLSLRTSLSCPSGTRFACFTSIPSGTQFTCFTSTPSGTQFTCFTSTASGTQFTCFTSIVQKYKY